MCTAGHLRHGTAWLNAYACPVVNTRRRDSARTRQRILTTARAHFAVHGYDRTTMRSVAAAAGVSANLITRYFGGKRGLFVAATELDLHIVDVLPGQKKKLGLRIATHVVARWEHRPGQDPLLTMMRAAMTDAVAAQQMADYFRRQAALPLIAHLGSADARERAASVGSFIMGSIVQRYVLAAGPAAEATAADFTSWLAHALQRLLTGPPFPLPTVVTARAG